MPSFASFQLGGVIWVGRTSPQINFCLPAWRWACIGLIFLASFHLRLLWWTNIYILFFFGVTCVPKNKVLTLVVGCLSWAAAAAASAEGKCNPPGTVQWGWTTAEACPLTACSGRYMTTLRMRMMRWAMLTLSKMISMPVRWVSNLCLQVVYLMTSSYPNSGHQKKTFTFRRSNWALRGDPGTRRYKASGVWGHTFILIYTQSFLSSYL